jgi:hypothetical protein
MASQEPTVLASVSSRPLPLWQGDLSTEEYALLQKEYWSTNGYFGLTAPPCTRLVNSEKTQCGQLYLLLLSV